MGNRPGRTGPRWLVCALLSWVAACGDDFEAAPQNERLDVTTEGLSGNSDSVFFFVSGTGIPADGSIGAEGSDPAGNPPTSTVVFQVPLGTKTVRAYGFAEYTVSPDVLPDAGGPFLRLVDVCDTMRWFGVRRATVVCRTFTLPAWVAAIERFVVRGDYVFDGNDRWAGSLDGSNVTRLVVVGAPASTAVQVRVDRGIAGCFASLPDPWTTGQAWPEPRTWGGCNGTTNAAGNAVFYLVARPGELMKTYDQDVVVGSARHRYALRVGGLGTLAATAE